MPSELQRVTVDLTPVLPGGENGGAKLVALTLVRELAQLAPATEFVLFTSAASHADLAALDAPNVRRECVDVDAVPLPENARMVARARSAARVLVDTLVPAGARSRIKDEVWTVIKRRRRARVAAATIADLHFCPFTAPFFFDQRVPLVSLVHDLQFVDLPEFFEPQVRTERLRHFEEACERAETLICVSDFVRTTVLKNSHLSPQRVHTIHSTVLHATTAPPESAAMARSLLARFGVTRPRFLLYPANPWPHKNHARLLEAFAACSRTRPRSDLALVCTGAPGPAADHIRETAATLLPGGAFAWAGYLDEVEFGALLQQCRALMFPSLYEGFGLPVLEAMACNRPVLCSNTTSLPEIAGDAALLFDPRHARSIEHAIDLLESDSSLEMDLVRRGRERLAIFGSARDMAARYLETFQEIIRRRG